MKPQTAKDLVESKFEELETKIEYLYRSLDNVVDYLIRNKQTEVVEEHESSLACNFNGCKGHKQASGEGVYNPPTPYIKHNYTKKG